MGQQINQQSFPQPWTNPTPDFEQPNKFDMAQAIQEMREGSAEFSLPSDLQVHNQDTFDSFQSSSKKLQPAVGKLSKLRGEYILTSGLDSLNENINQEE